MNKKFHTGKQKMTKNPLVVAGIHAMEEALSSGKTLSKVFFQRDAGNEKIRLLEKTCRQQNIPVVFVPKEKLNRISRANHQGIIGMLSPIDFHNLENLTQQLFEEGKNPVFVLFDRITDVRNVGAIARSAYFFGIHALILPAKESAAINDEAVKTSAGALLKVPVCLSFNLVQTLKFLKNSGFQIIAAHEKAEKNVAETDFSLPTVIILGSENEGIQMQLLAHVSGEVSIPGMGEFDSLNVSVAAGIIFYEIIQQRNSKLS
ncbi:MAG: 23S rRNA (guanosine(2251)-2'-O)-methyltransferase RlmB [Sphingobacteriales bacterium]|nr:23S rRNA (guanosine(2251)-2'-O)-methyltransferase RlmB [Sphingobacteriales bacterium]